MWRGTSRGAVRWGVMPHPGEVNVADRHRASITKRERERTRQQKRQDKEDKRKQRQEERSKRPDHEPGVDPDIAHIVPGPQAPQTEA